MVGIMAAIVVSLNMRTADDLFGWPQESPDECIAASVQWAESAGVSDSVTSINSVRLPLM